MRDRLSCAKHKRRHSLHAAAHCRNSVKAGECLDGRGRPRADRCPIYLKRSDR